MVDAGVLARKIAAIRDATTRIADVLPDTVEVFLADRTVREVVAFNVFLALQEAISLGAHWLADDGVEVPKSYGDIFVALGDRGVIETDLASRLRGAAGLRNLVAHQYGVLDFGRLFVIARQDVDDLRSFCQQLSRQATGT